MPMMKRSSFNIIAAVVWLAVISLGSLYYDQIYAFSVKSLGVLTTEKGAFPTVVFVALVIGVALHRYLADELSVRQVKLEKDMSADEKRARATREADLAKKMGRLGSALLIYEETGMYEEALKVAEEIGDNFGMARLCSRMRLYSRARRLYLEMEDYESAGHLSVVMGQMRAARENYKKAAEQSKQREALSEEGGLWERAGERKKAAEVYEVAGEMERAAECYALLGDEKNAERCRRQSQAMQAYERKQSGVTRQQWERQLEEKAAAAAKQARQLKDLSDFFGAALSFREAGEMLEAAQCFEKIEEWERAADAYDKAGLAERAEIARMNIPAKEAIPDEEAAEGEGGAHGAPVPKFEAGENFVAVVSPQAMPVYLAAAGVPAASAETRLNVCRRVRRGNFLEAAEFAKEAGDWLMAAAYYEHAHQYVHAADIYRQIADINAACWCLEKAGRLREAALLLLSVLQNERAVELLLKAIEDKNEVEENGLTLGELLIKEGKPDQAVELLRTQIARGQANESNAGIYYKFARLLEEHKAWKQAHALYRALLDAGADSEDLRNREARAAAMTGKPSDEITEKIKPAEPDKIDSMLAAATEAFTQRYGKPEESAADATGEAKTFAFSTTAEGSTVPDLDSAKTGEFLRPDLSLFGHAVGEAPPSESRDADTIFAAAPGEDESNPFLPARRYMKKGEVGRGGMGVVYHTHDTLLDRPVALKLLLNESSDPAAFQQFLVEARAVAVLSHANVITIYDIGLMGLRHYIAMEFVDGPSLGKVIRDEHVLAPKEALRIFIEICRGLKTAHDAGVVHRDIKPDNVLLTRDRQVKIGDFGLARMRKKTDGGRDAGKLEISGTPGFMPPEQMRGAEPHPVNDVYALGVTLFSMLVGRPPAAIAKKSSLQEILEFQESADRPSLRSLCPDIPATLERVYQYCAQPDPKKRYRAIDSFLPAVEEVYASLE